MEESFLTRHQGVLDVRSPNAVVLTEQVGALSEQFIGHLTAIHRFELDPAAMTCGRRSSPITRGCCRERGLGHDGVVEMG